MPDPVVPCANQKVLPQRVTQVDGVANVQKLSAFSTQQGQPATLEWTVRDPTGCAVNLTTCGGPVVLRLREALSIGHPSSFGVEIPTDPVDPANGVVQVTLTPAAVAYPGISRGEFGVFDAANVLLFTNPFLLIVNRSQWASEQTLLGPPSLPEVRLHMRDSSPADNLWLGVQEFDDAEIAYAITRPIEYWNEAPPPLDFNFNTSNFPWRYNWLNGAVATLYEMASLHYARTHMQYSAGGVQIDDKNRAQEYAKIGQQK